ncbi:YhcN/YlaJ family sporulation lipoprotein [Shimazuella sp. AN120528]|uniref:YhcN/YlaJ family sporulation lipoprotein n=1 Tax=Shimazuella soli TaxID=1892854 RepID=UPI001F0EFFF2|nr:YhcN/YlaJ family sporulation lipoprotein [Shimazuella soli]MCH5583901.1 YhcN/YlaJ family sporulation lipoprotein [Shimazuella soli]
MRQLLYGFLVILSIGVMGCARYHSQSPVQEQNMLPTRYQTNIDRTNSLYTRNANFVTRKTPTTGVRIENEIAKKILKVYPQLKAVSVVIIKNRAYVAVIPNSKMSSLGHLRVGIPALVKDMDAAVEKVYVSDNPGFRKIVEQHKK